MVDATRIAGSRPSRSGIAEGEASWCPLVGREEILVGSVPRTAYVHRRLTAVDALVMNLAEVAGAFEEAGLDHFVVRGAADTTGVVAVAAADRKRVLTVLARLGQRLPGYVHPVLPRPARRELFLPSEQEKSWRAVADAAVLRMIWFRADPTRHLVFGEEYGCDVEFWGVERDGSRLRAPRPNRAATTVDADGGAVTAPVAAFTRLLAPPAASVPAPVSVPAPASAGGHPVDRSDAAAPPGPRPRHPAERRPVRTRREMTVRLADDITFDVDVVCTVDPAPPVSAAPPRPRLGDHEELRYALRAIRMHAPWVRTVHVVTAGAVPGWLRPGPGLHLVSHTELSAGEGTPPGSGQYAVQSRLHHIDGLAEHFVHLHENVFLARPLPPQCFFLGNGMSRFVESELAVPSGPAEPGEPAAYTASRNDRRLIEDRFGVTVTRLVQPAPYALRRSVLAEMARAFPAEYAATAAGGPASTGLSPTSNLYHHYAFQTGRAVPGTLRAGYLQLALRDLRPRLRRLRERRDWDTFCLSDSESEHDDLPGQHRLVRFFLRDYFPVPSPYERS